MKYPPKWISWIVHTGISSSALNHSIRRHLSVGHIPFHGYAQTTCIRNRDARINCLHMCESVFIEQYLLKSSKFPSAPLEDARGALCPCLFARKLAACECNPFTRRYGKTKRVCPFYDRAKENKGNQQIMICHWSWESWAWASTTTWTHWYEIPGLSVVIPQGPLPAASASYLVALSSSELRSARPSNKHSVIN